ncbi:polysaccharide deacetylase family protein [Arthrobacter sp. TMS1-12-1]
MQTGEHRSRSATAQPHRSRRHRNRRPHSETLRLPLPVPCSAADPHRGSRGELTDPRGDHHPFHRAEPVLLGTRGTSGPHAPAPRARGIALTLDFCGGTGGGGADLTTIDLLRRLQVPATLFLNGRWITANPALAQDLAAVALFEVANHGTNHYPLSVNGAAAYGISGTEGTGSVDDEIMIDNARLAELTGARPRFFRPGTAYLLAEGRTFTTLCGALTP